jgi:hypothetical protein
VGLYISASNCTLQGTVLLQYLFELEILKYGAGLQIVPDLSGFFRVFSNNGRGRQLLAALELISFYIRIQMHPADLLPEGIGTIHPAKG